MAKCKRCQYYDDILDLIPPLFEYEYIFCDSQELVDEYKELGAKKIGDTITIKRIKNYG